MKKKELYFSIYMRDELENDFELDTQKDNFKDLSKYLGQNESTLYNLGLKKKKGLQIEITIKDKTYIIIVDSE